MCVTPKPTPSSIKVGTYHCFRVNVDVQLWFDRRDGKFLAEIDDASFTSETMRGLMAAIEEGEGTWSEPVKVIGVSNHHSASFKPFEVLMVKHSTVHGWRLADKDSGTSHGVYDRLLPYSDELHAALEAGHKNVVAAVKRESKAFAKFREVVKAQPQVERPAKALPAPAEVEVEAMDELRAKLETATREEVGELVAKVRGARRDRKALHDHLRDAIKTSK